MISPRALARALPIKASWDWVRRSGVRQWALAALIFVILTGFLMANFVPRTVDLAIGQVAKRDIEAPRRVIDRPRTEALRAEAARQALREAAEDPANLGINQALALQAEERVTAAFTAIEGVRSAGQGAQRPAASASEVKAVQQAVLEKAAVNLPEDLARAASTAPARALKTAGAGAAQLAVKILKEERIGDNSLAEARQAVDERLGSAELPDALKSLVGAVVKGVLQPNLVLDPQKLERAQEQAMRAVKPVYLEKGQIIIRKGDLVGPEHVEILQDLGMLGRQANYGAILGVGLIILLSMAFMGVYLYQQEPAILRNEKLLGLLGLIVVLVAALAEVASLVPFEGAGYLIPVGLAGMLIAILLDSHLALLSVVFLSVIVGVVFGQDAKYVMVALASGLAGVFSVSRVSQRSDLTRAGLVVGLATTVTMVTLGLLRAETGLIQYSVLGLVGGVICAVGTIGLLPYLESVFGITSALRLLELSNPNHPLLRKLLLEAPGSYHHSIIVGNLAEAASEAIGGDSLLTRVGAQYHDIGKTKRPYFFIENQFGGENPHDKISPTLSTLILTSHVKDGVEMAQKGGLPQVIVDFIREHHGTDLIRFFYHRALESGKNNGVKESDFRYTGPKPQTKETALVMLADSVEAAVRSLSRPTPGRIEALVRKIIKDRLNEGQLDECNLTLRDLDKVAEAFVRVLTGIFHNRISYPDALAREAEQKRA